MPDDRCARQQVVMPTRRRWLCNGRQATHRKPPCPNGTISVPRVRRPEGSTAKGLPHRDSSEPTYFARRERTDNMKTETRPPSASPPHVHLHGCVKFVYPAYTLLESKWSPPVTPPLLLHCSFISLLLGTFAFPASLFVRLVRMFKSCVFLGMLGCMSPGRVFELPSPVSSLPHYSQLSFTALFLPFLPCPGTFSSTETALGP